MYIAADHLVETDCSVQLKYIKNGFFDLIHPTNEEKVKLVSEKFLSCMLMSYLRQCNL